MKRALAFFRCGAWPMMGLLLISALGVGCSSKSASNPTAVTIDELKYPGDLVLLDKGGGKVTLQWTASNNESDFYGFNVYGMKGSPGTSTSGTLQHTEFQSTSKAIIPTEGQAFSLLDDKNKPSADASSVLALFDYDPTSATPLEKAGTPPAATTSSNDASADTSAAPVFSARPIATVDSSGAGIYPTCQVAATGNACVMTTSAGAGNTNVANGMITFDLSSAGTGSTSTLLNVGETYCFFVLSTMAKAAQVSATSSTFQCIVPSYFKSFSVTLPGPGTASAPTSLKFDTTAWAGTCTAANGCPDPTATAAKGKTTPFLLATDSVNSHDSNSATAIYIETLSTSYPSFVAGASSGVLDLGYYASGLADPGLPASAPPITVGTDYSAGGYSPPGQSTALQAGHVYVLATADGTTGKFFYAWAYVKSAATITVGVAQTVEFDVKLPSSSM